MRLPLLLISTFFFVVNLSADVGKIVKIEFKGNTSVTEKNLRKIIYTFEGNKIDSLRLVNDAQSISDYYADNELFFTRVNFIIIQIQKTNFFKLIFFIKEGMKLFVEHIDITGNVYTREDFIRNQLVVKSKTYLSRKDILESQQNLINTGIFSNINFENQKLNRDGNKIKLVLKVKEKMRHQTKFGLGVDSEDGLRLLGEWEKNNILGKGQKLYMNNMVSFKFLSFELAYLKRHTADVIYIYPDFLNYNWLDGTGGVFYESNKPSFASYGLIRFGTVVGLEERFFELLMFQQSLTFERINLFRVNIDEKIFRKQIGRDQINNMFSISLGYDTRDNYIDPISGIATNLSYDIAGGILLGDNHFNRLTGSVSAYFSLTETTILSGRFQSGIIEPFGASGDSLPSYLRFYSGGSTTLRGYSERSLGEKTPDGTSLGGYVNILGNVEIRKTFSRNLQVVAFWDSGNLWNDINQIKFKTFKNSIGIGLRLKIKYGFFRGDAGIKLNPEKDESPVQFHFGFGQVF